MDRITLLRVFSAVEFNADLPASELAKKLHLAPQTVSRALRLLQKDQNVTFQVRRNPWKMGLNNYSVFFEYKSSEENIAQLEKYLERHPSMEYYGRALGSYDAVAVIYAKSVAEVMAFLRDIERKKPKVIHRLTILTRLGVVLFPYRLEGVRIKHAKPLVYSIEDLSTQIDEVDQKVLDALQRCQEFNLRECSRHSKIPLATLSRRITNLRSKGIILAFNFVPTARLTGLTSHRLLINTSHTDETIRKELLKVCEQQHSVTALISTVGNWNFEIELASKHATEVRQLCLALKEKLQGAVRSIEHLEFVD